MYVAVDDTDSRESMCTTYLALQMAKAFEDLDLIGYPRLVRLNPNVPWKTRGNGAICLRLGRGLGKPQVVGMHEGRDVVAYPRGDGVEATKDSLDRVIEVLDRWAAMDEPTTNPGAAVLTRKPRPGLYWKAVRRIVTMEEALASFQHGLTGGFKNKRGIIGALSAASWRPRDRTYELLTYRPKERWGTRRYVEPRSVMTLDSRFPSTFNNYDRESDHVAIAPSSPCPILFGIRGDDPSVLPFAMRSVVSEPPESWLLFETNQATDDHILARSRPPFEPHTSIEVEGAVAEEPRVYHGGHVAFKLSMEEHLTCMAYEPTKSFRRVVRALLPGDLVKVWGSLRQTPPGLNLERMQILQLTPLMAKAHNPRCTLCGKRMKSKGRDGGYRCRRCHTQAEESAAETTAVRRPIEKGYYEPPVSARRHLAKPLKRMGVQAASSVRISANRAASGSRGP